MMMAGAVIHQLHILKISDEGQVTGVDEAAVVHDVAVGIGVDESGIGVSQREVEREAAVRWKRVGQSIEIKAMRRVFDDRRLAAFKAESPNVDLGTRDHALSL